MYVSEKLLTLSFQKKFLNRIYNEKALRQTLKITLLIYLITKKEMLKQKVNFAA